MVTDEDNKEKTAEEVIGKLTSHEVQFRIQQELDVPKTLNNEFGGYKYRSMETIAEAVKPLLEKYRATLDFQDQVVQIDDRFYVESTAILQAIGCTKPRKSKALAREVADKKKSDQAQITGASSSYARKYAASGLLLCDDSADDPDHNQQQHQQRGQDVYQQPFDQGQPHQQQQQQQQQYQQQPPPNMPPGNIDQGGPTRAELETIAVEICRSVNGTNTVEGLSQFYWQEQRSIDALPGDIKDRVMNEFTGRKNAILQGAV